MYSPTMDTTLLPSDSFLWKANQPFEVGSVEILEERSRFTRHWLLCKRLQA
jgi:hypothetical protein